MQLPVEQYYELDPNMIVPLYGNTFALMVPRVHVRHTPCCSMSPLPGSHAGWLRIVHACSCWACGWSRES